MWAGLRAEDRDVVVEETTKASSSSPEILGSSRCVKGSQQKY